MPSPDLREKPGFGPAILIAGANFGCGSSREQAAWALADLGIRCIIAPGFGEIFAANCARNGLLTIALGEVEWRQVLTANGALTVDLTAQTIHLADGATLGFAIDPAVRDALLGGLDEIGLILAKNGDAHRSVRSGTARQPAMAVEWGDGKWLIRNFAPHSMPGISSPFPAFRT